MTENVSLEEMLQRFDGGQTLVDEFKRHHADAHLITTNARCSIWWNNVPQLPDQKIGLIGHFESREDAAAREILDSACEHLKHHGRTLAIGPMDGSTWNRYRLVSDFGIEPPFFLEPWNPPRYPAHFIDAGFGVNATYSSAINDNLELQDPRYQHMQRRVDEAGVLIRQIDAQDFEAELKRIYEVCLISFRSNYLYTPIGEDNFLQQYAKVRPVLDPNLVLIAMQDARPVGFLFALPDALGKGRNAPPAVIFKTLAVLPERAQAGLGGYLIAECQKAARKLGYQRSIFALMHDSNASRSISTRYAIPMRRYTLFSKVL